jgi:CDP-diacylglycerol--glycerol-3-phosphate 3-phosphatidyltransferase
MTTANKITILRILLIPVFATLAVYYGQGVKAGSPNEWMRWCTIAVFVIAAASDGLDGYIARRYNQKSALGVVLDPIADKGLLLTAIVTLSFSNWSLEFPLWFPIAVISRDLIVLAGAATLRILSGEVQVRTKWSGKTATALQMTAISLAMLQPGFLLKPMPLFPALNTADVAPILAGFFTVLSGTQYVIDGIRNAHAEGHGDPKPFRDPQ